MSAPARTAELADPLELPCGQVLPNRLAKSAMSEALGDRANAPTAALERLYARWGREGCGLLVTGNVMVERGQLGEPGNVVVDDERDLEALRRWARAGQAGGAKVWVQVNHPGRQANPLAGGSRPVAPSAVASGIPGAVTPRPLTGAQVEDLVARYARTAAIVQAAGFDGVQLHGAHGYLISQFLSPLANQRTDPWGGDLDGRVRFVVEVLRATRAQVGAGFPIGIKLNSADFQRGGFTEEESMQVVERLVGEGIDLVEVSGGTYDAPAMLGPDQRKASTKAREAYFLTYAEEVRARAGDAALMVTGGFRTREGMAAALADGGCDLVGLGRPLAALPDAGAGLLDGSVDRVEAGSARLGIKKVDGAIDLMWHTRQLHRIGAGREPDLTEPGWRTAIAAVTSTGWGALRRKRGG